MPAKFHQARNCATAYLAVNDRGSAGGTGASAIAVLTFGSAFYGLNIAASSRLPLLQQISRPLMRLASGWFTCSSGPISKSCARQRGTNP